MRWNEKVPTFSDHSRDSSGSRVAVSRASVGVWPVRERLRFEPENGVACWRGLLRELPEQGACWDSSHLFLLKPEARSLPLLSSVDDGDGRWRRRAACIHSRCERPRPARPFACVSSHACSRCPSIRAALYPTSLHSSPSYACESNPALHPFTMRKAAARASLRMRPFACMLSLSIHARGSLSDMLALTALLLVCM